MKKSFYLILAVAGFALVGSTSCTKECTCVTKSTGFPDVTTTVEHKGKCSELNASQSVLGVTQEITCE